MGVGFLDEKKVESRGHHVAGQTGHQGASSVPVRRFWHSGQ